MITAAEILAVRDRVEALVVEVDRLYERAAADLPNSDAIESLDAARGSLHYAADDLRDAGADLRAEEVAG